ncbi:MAG: serine hydrolase domain-containing protein [Pseudomonadales bacterium]
MLAHAIGLPFFLGISLSLMTALSSAQSLNDTDARAVTAQAILAERNQRVLDGYLLAALALKTQAERTRFVPEWKRNPGHLGQVVRFGLSPQAFETAKRRFQHQGYRLSWSQQYAVSSLDKVAAIWTEHESSKVQFRSRVGFERAIANYRKEVPAGLAVAALRRGKIVFSRGFGEYEGRAVYADTAFPSLAASQAIAGILAARLEQEKHTAAGVPINLSLDWAIADLLPMMPSQPAFSAREVMAHTACIDNYYVEPNILESRNTGDSRPTSATYSLAKQVWERAPLGACVPGYLQSYSQPGYLLLGAFLEAATGHTVEQLLKNEISDRFGLASIQAAFVEEGNVLGLGIQSNALDFANLINGVFNGSILSLRTSRSRLWRKVNKHSEFGLGWRLSDRNSAEARDDTSASSVRIWIDHGDQDALVILAAQSSREHLDTLLQDLQRLL